MYWDFLSSPQLSSLQRNIPVILPIAATEQHGAHLPLATDRLIGEHFCRELNVRIKNEVLILPTISVGCSEHHLDFAGSLSVQHSTMLEQMKDIADCVITHGFKNLIIFNSHGGNQSIAGTFLEIFGFRNPDIQITAATWWRIGIEKLKSLTVSGPGGTGHAGEFETSLMLHIAPDLVNKDRITAKANVKTYDWAEGDMLVAGKANTYRKMKEMTSTGVYGDASFGSKKQGEEITEVVVNELVNIVQDLSKSTK